jgi:hypothetical protein
MATQLRDPNVITLAEAAVKLGVSESEAYRMARAGDFPGLISRVRQSGSPRRFLVSVPRFNQEVHGTTTRTAAANLNT